MFGFHGDIILEIARLSTFLFSETWGFIKDASIHHKYQDDIILQLVSSLYHSSSCPESKNDSEEFIHLFIHLFIKIKPFIEHLLIVRYMLWCWVGGKKVNKIVTVPDLTDFIA